MLDVAIVGAGPAGCAAANILAKRGFKVTIFEKEKLPRYKRCGGGVSLRCLNSFYKLDVDIEEVSLQDYKGFMLSYNDIKAESNLGRTIGWGVYRKDLDWLIAQSAIYNCARVCQSQFYGFKKENGIIKLSTKNGIKETRSLLAADGINSIIRRQLGIDYDKNKIGLCLVSEIQSPYEKIEEFNDLLHLDFTYLQKGFAWAFPKKQGQTINVGIGGYLNFIKKQPSSLKELLQRFVKANNLSDKIQTIHGALVPFGGTTDRFGEDNILLVGDAAGLASPLTGEGIPYALESGIIAAESVTDFFEKHIPLVENYTDNINYIIKEINQYAMILQHRLFGSDFHLKNIIKKCVSDDYLLEVISKVFTHIYSYKEGVEHLSPIKLLTYHRSN